MCLLSFPLFSNSAAPTQLRCSGTYFGDLVPAYGEECGVEGQEVRAPVYSASVAAIFLASEILFAASLFFEMLTCRAST